MCYLQIVLGVGASSMKRREFISLLGGAAAAPMLAPLGAPAQQSPPALIGLLQAGSAASTASYLDAFREATRQLGYIEGRNIRFEYRFADGILDRLPGLAPELVQLNPSVIVSEALPSNLAVQKATSTIPIVMGTGADPVGFGVVKSLAHPGGNGSRIEWYRPSSSSHFAPLWHSAAMGSKAPF